MLQDLVRPKALLRHLLVLVVVVTCISLGQWQFDRLAQVRASNALLEQRLEAPPLDLAELLAEPVDEEGLAFRRVAATGAFRPEQEVLQRGANIDNRQGFWVLTPFDLADGGVVLVRRGFVPATLDTPPVAEAAPPSGTVEVTGILERPVAQPSFGPQDPGEGTLARVFHTDTARLDRQIDGDLYPMVLRVQTDEPVAYDALPVPPGAPVLDERNHLSYGLQWYAFAALGLVTYVVWLVHRDRNRRRGENGITVRGDEPVEPPAPAGVPGP